MSDFKPLEELVVRSQKIGNDQSLVVFGGGNTSSKGEISDHFRRRKKVLWVKGSGADMQYGVDRDYPGLYLVGVVITGLTIAGFPYYGQNVVKGAILLLALIFSFTLSRKKSRFISAT